MATRMDGENVYYKRIHAMLIQGFDFDYIYSQVPELANWQVLEIIQKIEGRRMTKIEATDISREDAEMHEIKPERKRRFMRR